METGLQCVRRFFPRATMADAEYLLWEQTPWPIGAAVDELRRIAAEVHPKKRGWRGRLVRVCNRRTEEFEAELRAIAARTK